MLHVDLLGYGEVFKKGKKKPYSLLLSSCDKGSLMLYNSRGLMISSTAFLVCVAPKAKLPDNTGGLPWEAHTTRCHLFITLFNTYKVFRNSLVNRCLPRVSNNLLNKI